MEYMHRQPAELIGDSRDRFETEADNMFLGKWWWRF
jgi:hypothetical protein